MLTPEMCLALTWGTDRQTQVISMNSSLLSSLLRRPVLTQPQIKNGSPCLTTTCFSVRPEMDKCSIRGWSLGSRRTPIKIHLGPGLPVRGEMGLWPQGTLFLSRDPRLTRRAHARDPRHYPQCAGEWLVSEPVVNVLWYV